MWQNNQGLPIGGVLLHEHDLRYTTLTNHLDLPSLLPFASQSGMTDLGVRDIYALSHMEDVPFMVPNIKAGTIIPISGNTYTFEVASVSEVSTKIVSIDVENTKDLGKGGQPFKITLSNGRLGGFGARITPNPMLPYVFEVQNFQRKGVEEHVQYTLVYRGNIKGEQSVPLDVLQVGGFMYKLNATRSKEFGQEYDSWQVTAGVNRKYVSQITNSELQTHYHMTYEACNFADGAMVKDKKWVTDNLNKVVDFIGIKSPLNPAIKTLDQYLKAGGKYNKETLGFKFLATLYDKISIGILEKEIINTMVWEPGGVTGSSGFDKSYIHPGVWHQMDYSGYKHTYSIPLFSKELIISLIRDYESNKKSPTEYGKEREYKIRTGRAGVELLNKVFEKEFLAMTTGLTFADKLGQYSGNYQTGLNVFTPWYKSITIAGQYKLTWELDPSLDPTIADSIMNPLVNGYRLSSYSMIIEDADFSSSNIKILRNTLNGGGGMRMFVNNSTMSHPLSQRTAYGIPYHEGNNLGSGFAAYFHAVPDTAIVWDPTKMLKLVAINPYTGRSFL